MKSQEIRKAAIVLLSLDRQTAAEVLSRMDGQLVEAVTTEIARLNDVTPEEQQSALNEFYQMKLAQTHIEQGGMDYARALIEQSLGKERANQVLETVRQSIEATPFGFLQRAPTEHLLTFILDEHPQTIALVLSFLPASQAAEVLTGLPAAKQIEVVRRIANMQQTNPDVVREVEKGLETRMAAIVHQQFEKAGGVNAVAQILNVAGRPTERAILENLEQEDPQLVEQIRRLMFVFDDILKLDDRAIQRLLKEVETSQWAMALKGAPEELKQRIMGNMSQRAATLLKEEIEYLGPVRVSDVEAMQQQIVDVVRRLEDDGELIMADSGAEQYIE